MTVIDLFSGVGGFSLGLKKAGYDIVLANEIDIQISDSYKKNHSETLMINSDISNLLENFDDLISQNCKDQKIDNVLLNKKLLNIDLIVGGPPCQGFSMAGGRIRKKNQFLDDPRNYLFKQYFKVIQKFEPKYFIFENVVGISSMNNGEILSEIETIFQDKSNFNNGKYYLQKKIFLASDFGIPQKRKRFIIIGSKVPFDLEEKILETKNNIDSDFCKSVTIHDAISDLCYDDFSIYTEKQKYLKKPISKYQEQMRNGNESLQNHILHNHKPLTLDRISRIKSGNNWESLDEKNKIKSVHSGAYGRMEWDEQSATITTRFDTPSGGRFIHPTLNRNITIREAARIQSFSDDFIFYGNKTSICKQIGNAVPPKLGEFLGYLIKNI